jgi:hypothetical protein
MMAPRNMTPLFFLMAVFALACGVLAYDLARIWRAL